MGTFTAVLVVAGAALVLPRLWPALLGAALVETSQRLRHEHCGWSRPPRSNILGTSHSLEGALGALSIPNSPYTTADDTSSWLLGIETKGLARGAPYRSNRKPGRKHRKC